MIKTYFAAIAMLISSTVSADPYFTAAIGNSKYFLEPAGTWYQPPFPHRIEGDSNSYRVGLGDSFNSRWGWEIGFENYGDISGYTWFVSDENYNGHGCNGSCEAKRFAYFVGEAKAITADIHLKKTWTDWEIYALGGVTYFQSKFIAYASALSDAYVPMADPYLGDYDAKTQRGLGGRYGVGVRYKDLTLSVVDSPNVHAKTGVYHGVRNIWLGTRWGF